MLLNALQCTSWTQTHTLHRIRLAHTDAGLERKMEFEFDRLWKILIIHFGFNYITRLPTLA